MSHFMVVFVTEKHYQLNLITRYLSLNYSLWEASRISQIPVKFISNYEWLCVGDCS